MKKISLIIHLSLFIFLCIFFNACQEELDPVYQVPDEIQPYVDKFLEEASKRGFDYQIDNLIIQYDNELGAEVCGVCSSNSQVPSQQRIIRINPKCNYNGDLELETLIFHELGHCVLDRRHEATLLPNGDPKSIMVANDISLYSFCIYPVGNQPCNFTFKREYYLDELFDEKTPVPDWAK